ncbi:NfeD family protein [uncultured Anaerofustis sp.]|uniref:NfeD family protein n=1 Tax=uncultured Anaerofustis sp. TaxID=904996 RepID=UPI0025EF4930|nr:NfeD family protein [uncultured Anaerofustis sp.]
MNFTSENMILIWLVLLVLFVVVELLTTQLVSIWFAGGSLISLILSFLDVSIAVQIIVFFITSVIFLCITYPLYHKYVKSEIVPLNADSLIGLYGIVIKEINNKKAVGQIKVKGQVWSALNEIDEIISEGEEVKIIKIEGVHVIVQKKEEERG